MADRWGGEQRVETHLAPAPAEADRLVDALPPGSMVVNATGLGKDAPGSPLTAAAMFPESGIAWEFNYRGDLVFLDQARHQQAERGLLIEDGWTYFVLGWSQVVGDVFDVDVAVGGEVFEALSQAAARARG
jgi:shikimate 5-dehydrogenase